ncbi:ferritin-like domain-containing protein [Guyparkeria halopsychrophila]|uniref:ferritin-like domain-containing protein n=1 Tax=Guyparkeria halopsychrophila TaxID=3139421 RepID=UPI0037C5C01D
MSQTIRERAGILLRDNDPSVKADGVRALYDEAMAAADVTVPRTPGSIEPVPDPGRPERPTLVAPRDVPKRGPATPEGRASMAHSFAHIEFNAMNIGLDACYRFDAMPADFYRDWLSVARDEAKHFELLNAYLRERGYEYGSFPAHASLWETVHDTEHDVMVRMALIPRVLEARGLDVTPGIQRKLAQYDDQPLIDILDVIYNEEIQHVEIGTRWFRFACEQRGVDPRQTFRELLQHYMAGRIRGPYDEFGRKAAGFTDGEMQDLKDMEAETLAQLEGK